VSRAVGGGSGLSRLGGARMRIVPADTRSVAAVGANAVANLVNRYRVAGVVGAYDTDVTAAASQQAERLRVPLGNGDTAADFLTERGLDGFFRVGPADRTLGEAVFSTLRQLQTRDRTARSERIGIVYANDVQSNGELASALELIGEATAF